MAKNNNLLKTMLLSVVLVLVTAFTIIADFMVFSSSSSFFRNKAYWLNALTVNAAVIVIVFVARAEGKDRERRKNTRLAGLTDGIRDAYNALAKYSLNVEFREYINQDNLARKIDAYTDKWKRRRIFWQTRLTHKVNRVKRKLAKKRVRSEETIQAKTNKVGHWYRDRIALCNDRIANAATDVDFLRVRYKRVSYSLIFSGEKERENAEADLAVHESRDIMALLASRVVGIVAFGVVATSVWTFDAKLFSVMTIYKALFKVLQLLLGFYTGWASGRAFVKGRLCGTLEKRLSYVRIFQEQRKSA